MTPSIGDLGIERVSSPPRMRRINGCGLTLIGRYDEPLLKGYYYKQLVFTLLFVPVFLGPIYLVQDAARNVRPIGGKMARVNFVKRFGSKAYFAFLGRALLETILLIVLIASLLVTLAMLMGKH